MGKKLMKEMDRVFTAVSASETRRPQQLAANNTASAPNGYNSTLHFSNQNPIAEMPMAGNEQIVDFNFDQSIFDSVAGIDLFGMFDPAFDLDGFDACLEGNLNPAFPNPFQ